MSIGINQYTGLITSEHNQRPKFVAAVSTTAQPFVDLQNALLGLLFDVDTAQGQQLDFVGQWVGQSRNITVPLPDVFFSWGISGLGWGQATWFGPNDVASGLVVLPDDSYRVLLKAKIAANQWDGTVPGAYNIWAIVFAIEGFNLLIQDNQDMTMTMILLSSFFLSSSVTAVVLALLVNGYLDLRPAGVRITGYFQSSVPGAPLFGWGLNTPAVAGWGAGAWIQQIS